MRLNRSFSAALVESMKLQAASWAWEVKCLLRKWPSWANWNWHSRHDPDTGNPIVIVLKPDKSPMPIIPPHTMRSK
jgi:hypothetical protein